MRYLLLLAFLLTPGCAQLNGLRTDLSAKPAVTGNEENALRQNLKAAYNSCVGPVGPCDAFKLEDDPDRIRPFVEAGMTLSDYYCDMFFRQTNTAARKRRFSRNATNDVGGVISAILGLAKAGSGVTGGIAAGFSFADSGFRNYDESFMVDADLSKLRRLVLSAQDNMKKAIFANSPRSYFAAESTVIRYAGLCSFLGMQDLLNDAVTEKTSRIEAATTNPKLEADPTGTTGATTITTTTSTKPVAPGKPAAPVVTTVQQTTKTTSSTTTPAEATTDAQAAEAATDPVRVAPPPPPGPQ